MNNIDTMQKLANLLKHTTAGEIYLNYLIGEEVRLLIGRYEEVAVTVPHELREQEKELLSTALRNVLITVKSELYEYDEPLFRAIENEMKETL